MTFSELDTSVIKLSRRHGGERRYIWLFRRSGDGDTPCDDAATTRSYAGVPCATRTFAPVPAARRSRSVVVFVHARLNSTHQQAPLRSIAHCDAHPLNSPVSVFVCLSLPFACAPQDLTARSLSSRQVLSLLLAPSGSRDHSYRGARGQDQAAARAARISGFQPHSRRLALTAPWLCHERLGR